MKLSQVKIRDYLLSSEKFKNSIEKEKIFCSQLSLWIKPDALLSFCENMSKDRDLNFDFLMDVTAVDYIKEKPRFEVVYQLFSTKFHHRIRLKVRLEESKPHIQSLVSLWRSADWMEREVFDMYGIIFDGHGDLRRILLYPEFEGYPLRKDYPMMKEQPLVALRDVGEVDMYIDQNILVRK